MSESLRELARVLAQNERIPRWKQLVQARIDGCNSCIQQMVDSDAKFGSNIHKEAIQSNSDHQYGLIVALQLFETEVEKSH